MTKRLVVCLCAALAVSCGGKKDSPTAPTPTPTAPAPPTVSGLSISGLDAIRSDFFTNFTAQATLSDGTTQAVTPTWSSANQSIATVASNGDVSGISNGIATINAAHQGRTASRTIRIVSNFGGSWTGNYRISKCDQDRTFAGWCGGLGGVGAVLPVGLSLSQGGNGRDQITGTLALGSIVGNTQGNVTGDGRLVIGGTFTTNAGGVVFVVTVGGWDSKLSGSTGMTGRWSQSIAANGFPGNAYQENDFLTIVHNTPQRTAQRDTGDTASGSVIATAPGVYHLTLQQFLLRMRSGS